MDLVTACDGEGPQILEALRRERASDFLREGRR